MCYLLNAVNSCDGPHSFHSNFSHRFNSLTSHSHFLSQILPLLFIDTSYTAPFFLFLSVSSHRLRSSPCPSLLHLLVLLFYLYIRSFPSITALLSSPASCFPSSPSLIFASTRLSFSSLSQIKLHPPSFLSSLFPPLCTPSSPFHPLTVRPPFPPFFKSSLYTPLSSSSHVTSPNFIPVSISLSFLIPSRRCITLPFSSPSTSCSPSWPPSPISLIPPTFSLV